MRPIQKNKFLYHTLFLLVWLISSTGCQQTGSLEKTSQTRKPHHRTIKNGAQYAEDVNSGKIQKDDFIGSPVRTTSATISGFNIKIKYSSPGVRGRKIWGNIVPYNKVWVTGANHATAITIDHEVFINDKKLPAGTYAIFTIPRKGDWVVIVNKNADQHGTDDYGEKEDVLRFTVHPTQIPAPVLRLTYKIGQESDGSAEISMMWERYNIAFAVKRSGL
jgi:hypothetical protein